MDNVVAQELENLAPHKSVFGLDAPRVVSRNLSMPKPVIATISHWMSHAGNEAIDPVKQQRMDELFTDA